MHRLFISRRLAPAAYLLGLWLAACAPAGSRASAIQGRWQRLDTGAQTFVGDPLGSLAQETIEFRDRGQLVVLLSNARGVFTVSAGGYTLVDDTHLQIDGKCWQGYTSHPCSQTYRFTLSGDRLTVFGDGEKIADGPVANGQLDYQRAGPAAAALPPTLAPPMPSATP